ncbi:hypothetical protein GCM10008090_27130 [Arenicella chitinivorans]|uniref:Endonuclease/exonuclease/phosphatase domain-containing protein n=1 Tax=Arenicella chitinivorans TaxID=1329800 RepID=A0A918RYI6_9GAMM|nr:endonuclease/exonuclease/phosphatase family protein [Arenicella chitinivorans]GHA15977.1 hypothetical protein GCM10008090_27130 [Arenicella chitinivorans]
MDHLSIRDIQGDSLTSPYAGKTVLVHGMVTGVLRRGFYVQTPDKEWDERGSDAVFVYSPLWKPELDDYLEVHGECVDYYKHETAKPVTQIQLDQAHVLNAKGRRVRPLELTQELLPQGNDELATVLNSLEGMLLRIAPGQTFIAPSNFHGDYVIAMDAPKPDTSMIRSPQGGAIVQAENPMRWYPGFRIFNPNHAVRVNLGATLTSPVVGPLHYRSDAYQLAVSAAFEFDQNFVELSASSIRSRAGAISILTLNCFNLDPHVEAQTRVTNPRLDVDDDVGEGRFHTLAQAIVLQAQLPDIIALQEIQDNDGAELTTEVDASATYALLIALIKELSGVEYQAIDVAPVSGQDGGQPGGNIRNAYLYRPDRVVLDPRSVRVLGQDDPSFADSRKALVCHFTEQASGETLAVINVHLASKRHQASIFAPTAFAPGVDAKADVRHAQARAIRVEMDALSAAGIEYYVTGDFNDTEHSDTLAIITGEDATNLVLSLPPEERYDYNHRGKLQVLMHGVVSNATATQRDCQYEILHGNELIGVTPGEVSDKPSDHAYVIAQIGFSGSGD